MRFEALDMLRGIAALLVAEWHYPLLTGVRPHFGRAYLSVDLFFILSGFVIAHAYHGWLTNGGTPGGFLRARIIRLYPLYLIAALLSSAIWIAWIVRHGPEDLTYAMWMVTFLPSLFMLPSVPAWSFRPDILFPFNAQAWSLLFELVVNMLYALLALRLRPRTVALLAAAGAVLACAGAWREGDLNLGWVWDTAAFGFGRALFGFFAGFAVWLAWRRWPPPAVPSWLLVAAFMALASPNSLSFGWAYDFGAAMLLFPALVWLAAHGTHPRWLGWASTQLGLASYGVYVLQGPALRFLHLLWGLLFHTELKQSGDWGLATFILLVLTASWMITKRIDEPLRAQLIARFVPDRPGLPAQTAP